MKGIYCSLGTVSALQCIGFLCYTHAVYVYVIAPYPCEGYKAFIITSLLGYACGHGDYKLCYISNGGGITNLFPVLSQTAHAHQM